MIQYNQYLYSIYIVSGITNNPGMTWSIREGMCRLYTNTTLFLYNRLVHLRILISTGVLETIFYKYQGTAVLLIYLLSKCNRPVRLRFDEVWKFAQSHWASSNITAGIWSKSELIQKDHGVASFVETCLLVILPLALGNNIRHPLSQWSWCCEEEIRG